MRKKRSCPAACENFRIADVKHESMRFLVDLEYI